MKTTTVVLFALVLSQPLSAQWPQFRGPEGTGHSASTDLPLTWAEGKNVKWKTAVHGRAWSSPVILGNQVWMTTATPDGRELFAVALDRDSGKIVFDLKLFRCRDASVCASVQYLRVADARHRARPCVCDVRVTRHRRDRHQDRQGHLGAPRLRVQSFSRRGLVADSLRGSAAYALRRQRPSVRRRARQAHGQDRLADAAVDRFSGSRPGRQAEGGRRFPQGLCDAADRDGRGPPGHGERRIEGGLRLRPADRQGAVESDRARQPLGQLAAGGGARSRVRADGV